MGTRNVAFGLAAAALVIACGTSNVADDAEVSITGRLLLPDGTPASAITVGLVEQPRGLDAIAELGAAVTSIGLLCLAQEVAICQGARRATTGDDGGYQFTMTGREAKTILGNPAEFVLSAQLASGAAIQIRFAAAETAIEVPRVSFWQPDELSVTSGTQWVSYSWPALQHDPAPSGYRYEITEGQETVWVQASDPAGKLDARAVADTQGAFRAVAIVEYDGFRVEHHSQQAELRGAAGAPASRDAACTIAGATGPVPLQPCTFTDGRYAGSFPSQSCTDASPAPTPCPADQWLTVDLGAARSIDAVVLHGLSLSGDILITTSEDGNTWTKRARHPQAEYALLTMEPPARARYVRLESGSGTSPILELHEIAIWP